ncbi:MAG TPA: hypothetical protein VK763_00365 [Terriglobales bacterium]|jgi:hypothetical protein|nr:hypothetical protein [Terriglobales bacterium]
MRILSLLLAVVTLWAAILPAHAQDYSRDITETSAWFATQQLPDGAILYTSTEIEPYFANLAAIGWLEDETRIPQVEAWMSWYIAHLNWPDRWGEYGTIYDYNVAGITETSLDTFDSADSYAATFLSLAEALWNTGDPGAQSFIKDTIGRYNLNVIGNVITNLQQRNGLVYAMPTHQVEYLMDNSEDYRGLMDFARLAAQAWGDAAAASWYTAHAGAIQAGIQGALYIPSGGLYRPYAGSDAPNLKTWYPDSVAQLYPMVHGVVAPGSSRSNITYAAFNQAWPGWVDLSFNSQDEFPWVVVSYAAFLTQDKTRVDRYIDTIQNRYLLANPMFPWPWYGAEAGWFMRVNAGILAHQLR